MFLFRGSSDDDRLDGKRSAQSTPRLKRHLVNLGNSKDSHRSFGSLGSVEINRVRQSDNASDYSRNALSRSFDADRVLGLDRAWETERIKGMELLSRSMERRERGRAKQKKKKKDRHKTYASDEKRSRSREAAEQGRVELMKVRIQGCWFYSELFLKNYPQERPHYSLVRARYWLICRLACICIAGMKLITNI